MAHDVFISHSSVNKAVADAICHALEANGIRCWIAPRDIPPGSQYGEQITRGLKECKVFLLVFSDEANKSSPVNKEVERAVLGYKKIAIPFRIEDVPMNDNMEFFLSDSQWVDAVKHGEIHWLDLYPDDTVFQELVVAINNILGNNNASANISHGGIALSDGEQKAYDELKNAFSGTFEEASVTPSSDNAQINFPSVYEKQPPTQNPIASSVGNLVNSGKMAEGNGFIYYSKHDGIIYKYPIDDFGGRVEIYKDPNSKSICGLNVQGNTIFFYVFEKGICRINTDGTDFSIVRSNKEINSEFQNLMPQEMIVLEKSIVLRFSKDYKPVLCIMCLETGETKVISESDETCEGLTYYNGWLYFSYKNEFEKGSIARIRPDGTGREMVAEDQEATNILIDDEFIYYFVFYDACQYKVRHDGTSREKISIDRGNEHFNMSNDSIYYDYGWGIASQQMYRYKKDGSANEMILATDHRNEFGIYILNDQIYFIDGNIIYRMNPDGTNMEKMKM